MTTTPPTPPWVGIRRAGRHNPPCGCCGGFRDLIVSGIHACRPCDFPAGNPGIREEPPREGTP